MSAVRWRAPRVSRPPAHVRIHTCPTKRDVNAPEEVAFLDHAWGAEVHFLRDSAGRKGKSELCDGPENGCRFCLSGTSPMVVNYYAPALFHEPGLRTSDGKPVWERLVYYIPQGSLEGFHGGDIRGRMFKVWRQASGAVDQIRNRIAGRVEFAEKPFDVRPVIEHHFKPTSETVMSLSVLCSKFPDHITPPKFFVPSEPTVRPAGVEEMNAMRAKVGKAPLSPEEEAALFLAQSKIKFKGTSLDERIENGTYNPGHGGTEGGAE